MLKHRGGVLTPYGAATPLCPSGYDGTGPSASLGLLAVAHGYALASLRSAVSQARLGAPPRIWPRGARNAARPTSATPFYGSPLGGSLLGAGTFERAFALS
jgi:hypothetical protein